MKIITVQIILLMVALSTVDAVAMIDEKAERLFAQGPYEVWVYPNWCRERVFYEVRQKSTGKALSSVPNRNIFDRTRKVVSQKCKRAKYISLISKDSEYWEEYVEYRGSALELENNSAAIPSNGQPKQRFSFQGFEVKTEYQRPYNGAFADVYGSKLDCTSNILEFEITKIPNSARTLEAYPEEFLEKVRSEALFICPNARQVKLKSVQGVRAKLTYTITINIHQNIPYQEYSSQIKNIYRVLLAEAKQELGQYVIWTEQRLYFTDQDPRNCHPVLLFRSTLNPLKWLVEDYLDVPSDSFDWRKNPLNNQIKYHNKDELLAALSDVCRQFPEPRPAITLIIDNPFDLGLVSGESVDELKLSPASSNGQATVYEGARWSFTANQVTKIPETDREWELLELESSRDGTRDIRPLQRSTAVTEQQKLAARNRANRVREAAAAEERARKQERLEEEKAYRRSYARCEYEAVRRSLTFCSYSEPSNDWTCSYPLLDEDQAPLARFACGGGFSMDGEVFYYSKRKDRCYVNLQQAYDNICPTGVKP